AAASSQGVRGRPRSAAACPRAASPEAASIIQRSTPPKLWLRFALTKRRRTRRARIVGGRLPRVKPGSTARRGRPANSMARIRSHLGCEGSSQDVASDKVDPDGGSALRSGHPTDAAEADSGSHPSGYEAYQARASNRRIPVIVLEPGAEMMVGVGRRTITSRPGEGENEAKRFRGNAEAASFSKGGAEVRTPRLRVASANQGANRNTLGSDRRSPTSAALFLAAITAGCTVSMTGRQPQ